MFVDDTGMLDGKPVNAKATALYRAICKRGTEHQIHHLKDLLAKQAQLNASLDLDKHGAQIVDEGRDADSRVAYGFRNFENYRQRVKVLCS
jgi:hypothetical protein